MPGLGLGRATELEELEELALLEEATELEEVMELEVTELEDATELEDVTELEDITELEDLMELEELLELDFMLDATLDVVGRSVVELLVSLITGLEEEVILTLEEVVTTALAVEVKGLTQFIFMIVHAGLEGPAPMMGNYIQSFLKIKCKNMVSDQNECESKGMTCIKLNNPNEWKLNN